MNDRPNILIVDDTATNLIFLNVIIRKMDVNLIEASSGEEALGKIRGVELALAIIDVRMPVMDGYQLAMIINEERKADKVPILLLTANRVDEHEIMRGYACGAADYLFKPISPHILQAKITVFIELYRQKKIITRDAELLKESAAILTRVNAVISKTEAKYRNYIDNAPDGVFVTDEKGNYIEVNRAACLITGYEQEELLKLSVSGISWPESTQAASASFAKLVSEGSSKAELMFRHKSGVGRWWSMESVKLSRTRCLVFASDITSRKFMEATIEHSNQLLSGVLDNTFMMAAYLDPEFNFVWVNRIYAELSLKDASWFQGKNHFDIYPDEENEAIFRRVVETGEPFFVEAKPFNFPGQPDRGTTYWDWSLFAITNEQSNITGLAFTLAEVTARIRAEKELENSLEKLQQLGLHIEEVRESERVAIARELHDDLGQALTAVKIDLGMMRKKIADLDTLERLNKTYDLVSDTIRSVQRITSELRPHIIDDLGLTDAVEWYAREFGQRTGIETILRPDTVPSSSSNTSLLVFRILQESLTNIARHSGATRVEINLASDAGNILLSVYDNGKGITREQINAGNSFGIIGMKERAGSQGGKFEIRPGARGGTEVKLVVPFNRN